FSQTLATDDEVLKNIWAEAMDNSQLEQLAHELLDVIGPRLVGTPQMQKAHEWAVGKYAGWNVEAKNEEWGKWRGWERGVTHIDLLEPRVRTLEGMMLAWSPSTKKKGVTAELIIMADAADSLAFQAWLPNVKGKFVLISMPQPTGRADASWEEYALKESFKKMKAERDSLRKNWRERLRKTGYNRRNFHPVLENAGAAGIISSSWSSGWGVTRIFGTTTKKIPVVDLSLEDYGLLYRLVEHGGNPKVRIVAESKFTGEVPAMNTIAKLPGSEKPNEYVILSAHFDSWDGASGATDNGTGTLTMMEAMRILKKFYPNPKRTILVGHWGSEEQGLNGSRAFVKDHPDIVENLQASFNQDNGTGRVTRISGQGFIDAGDYLGRWLARVPSEVTEHIKLTFPGMPSGGGSDHASFVAAGAPAFMIGSLNWDYFRYTWHTTRDTYDKLIFDDLKNNVILAASLAYLASEDPESTSREKRVLPMSERTGKQREWPKVREPERAGGLEKKEATNSKK
ncbi:MAG: M20/M25/M40 family metallo-hydrolase, partial [bacterium]